MEPSANEAELTENETKEAPVLKKNFFRLILLIIAGASIFTLPYFRSFYYDTYLEMYQLTNLQMGSLGSIYGLFGLLAIIGGVMADAMSVKKILSASLILMGLGGFLHLVVTTYAMLIVIYTIWGIVASIIFWPSLIKALRMLGNKDEQGKLFGMFEGGRGIVNAAVYPIGLAIFGLLAASVNEFAGLRGVNIFFSVLTTACGVGIIIFIQEAKHEKKTDREKFDFKQVIAIIKMPAIWLMTLILFMSYMFNMSFFYFTPYSSQVFGASAIFAAALAMLSQYCRPIASISSGFLGARIGNSYVRLGSMFFMGLGIMSVIFIPASANMMPILIAACAVIFIAMYLNYGLIFAMLEEGKVPVALSGVAVGVVSTIGYLPEVVAPLIAGSLLDRYPGDLGFKIYFAILAGCAVAGMIGIAVWMKKFGNHKIVAAKS